MANHLGPTMQCKLHSKAKASEHEKTEGSEFFNGSSFELLKNPRGTWDGKALKNVVLGLHRGKAVSEPIKQVMKLNLRGMGRKCVMESGAEGTVGEVILSKSKKVLGRHERNTCSSLWDSLAYQEEIFRWSDIGDYFCPSCLLSFGELNQSVA